MNNTKKIIDDILSCTHHRNFELPENACSGIQIWEDVVFLHWAVKPKKIRKYLPAPLELDCFNGKAWITLIGANVSEINGWLKLLKGGYKNGEISIRTYVTHNSIQGFYHLNLEEGSFLSVRLKRFFSGLLYQREEIDRLGSLFYYKGFNGKSLMNFRYFEHRKLLNKTELDKWLTRRFCVFEKRKHTLYRYDIHHKKWPLKKAGVYPIEFQLNWEGKKIIDNIVPKICHYVASHTILLWNKTKLLT